MGEVVVSLRKSMVVMVTLIEVVIAAAPPPPPMPLVEPAGTTTPCSSTATIGPPPKEVVKGGKDGAEVMTVAGVPMVAVHGAVTVSAGLMSMPLTMTFPGLLLVTTGMRMVSGAAMTMGAMVYAWLVTVAAVSRASFVSWDGTWTAQGTP